MRSYEMSGVVFTPAGGYLALEVPGLAEKRPSLMLGDSVVATRPGHGEAYEGNIHEVKLKSIPSRLRKID